MILSNYLFGTRQKAWRLDYVLRRFLLAARELASQVIVLDFVCLLVERAVIAVLFLGSHSDFDLFHYPWNIAFVLSVFVFAVETPKPLELALGQTAN